jgi:hypothetical protein
MRNRTEVLVCLANQLINWLKNCVQPDGLFPLEWLFNRTMEGHT